MSDELIVIPKATLSRLPLYLRMLTELLHLDIQLLSSEEIATRMGITSSQLRKDLSYFGGHGIRGTGYDVAYLLEKIKEILGMDKKWRIAIIGAGKLGTALAGYKGLRQHGMEVTGLFDIDETKIGWRIGEIPVYHIAELSKKKQELGMEIATITVPKDAAQQVADLAVKAGFRGIWNFAPIRIEVPANVFLRNEDIVVGVLTLSHHLSRLTR